MAAEVTRAVDDGADTDMEAVRTEVRAFLADNLPDGWRGVGTLGAAERDTFQERWRVTMHEAGYLAMSWPTEYGGAGRPSAHEVVLHEELTRVGAPLGIPTDVFGFQMIGPTLLRWGTEEQKRYFLPLILNGEHRWCQGYSEPNSGSDLASVSTYAVDEGDHWSLHGQKVWTSFGHLANWVFVLCRTDREQVRHKGLSMLLVPLGQPGAELRPIKMLTGSNEFNELFLDGARCAAEHVLGGVGNGWAVALSLLDLERGEAAAVFPMRFRDEFERLRRLAAEHGRIDDPIIRQGLARCYTDVEVLRYIGRTSLASRTSGRPLGAEASVFKLAWSEYHQRATNLATQILGAAAMTPEGRWPATVDGPDDLGATNSSASWVGTFLNARAGTIYSGTSQIQRNVIGEQVLGLPREPRP